MNTHRKRKCHPGEANLNLKRYAQYLKVIFLSSPVNIQFAAGGKHLFPPLPPRDKINLKIKEHKIILYDFLIYRFSV